jgi:hypothetical protein
MSTADTLAAVVADLRPVADDLALPDTCAAVRKVEGARDSRGNPTYTESTVLTARCRLRSGGLRPTEQAVADQVQATTPYAIDLPYATVVTPADAIVVNATRRFELLGIVKDGGYGVFTTAIAEERS